MLKDTNSLGNHRFASLLSQLWLFIVNVTRLSQMFYQLGFLKKHEFFNFLLIMSVYLPIVKPSDASWLSSLKNAEKHKFI